MKTITVAIDVTYTKYIKVNVPDIKGTEDWEIAEKAAEEELKRLPNELDGFFSNYVNVEEVSI